MRIYVLDSDEGTRSMLLYVLGEQSYTASGFETADLFKAALRAELEKARKSAAAMDNKALAEFGVLFRQAQETVNRLTELAGELDEENRPKVYRALDALRNMIAEKAGEATA